MTNMTNKLIRETHNLILRILLGNMNFRILKIYTKFKNEFVFNKKYK